MVSLSVDVVLPAVHNSLSPSASVAAFLAARVNAGGCSTSKASGMFFWIDTAATWTVSSNLGTRKVKSQI